MLALFALALSWHRKVLYGEEGKCFKDSYSNWQLDRAERRNTVLLDGSLGGFFMGPYVDLYVDVHVDLRLHLYELFM